MLIMTQGKSELVNLSNTETVCAANIYLEDGCGIFAKTVRGESVLLGKYESENRAEEVLQEIFMEYRIPGKSVYEMPET